MEVKFGWGGVGWVFGWWAGLEKVGYLGSGAASQFQISQPILAGPKAKPANTGIRQPSIC